MSTETKLDLDAIEARVAAATPGSWRAHQQYQSKLEQVESVADWHVCGDASPQDADFIAHAREDIPALCTALREARQSIATWMAKEADAYGNWKAAEAGAGQMRRAVERALGEPAILPGEKRVFEEALATDAGKGWVSPEAHAEVVRERDDWKERAKLSEAGRKGAVADAEKAEVQLGGCLTAAEGGTSNPAVRGDYGWSVAYQRTLDLYARAEKAEARVARLERHVDTARVMLEDVKRTRPHVNVGAIDGVLSLIEAAPTSGTRGAK